jgi:hypothetical protein
MSHFTRVKTQINDRGMLITALTELKYGLSEHHVVRGYQGDSTRADVVVKLQGDYDIGFERGSDGNYQVVADWWGVGKDAKLDTKSFLDPVTQRYAYHKVVAEVAKQGFQVVQETTGVDRTLKVTLRRWG